MKFLMIAMMTVAGLAHAGAAKDYANCVKLDGKWTSAPGSHAACALEGVSDNSFYCTVTGQSSYFQALVINLDKGSVLGSFKDSYGDWNDLSTSDVFLKVVAATNAKPTHIAIEYLPYRDIYDIDFDLVGGKGVATEYEFMDCLGERYFSNAIECHQ